MRLKLPHGLRYPITVTELLKRKDDDVQRNEPILKFTYKGFVEEDDEFRETHRVEKTFPSRFESEAEGTFHKWLVREQQVINAPMDIAEIVEGCSHEMQWAGVCSLCGKDMTVGAGYNTRVKGMDRAAVNMVHDNTMLRVSSNVALQAENEAKRRLIKEKKLSLVVDLDMTIIHATVDPTVEEWQQDPENPNYESVADVESFRLKDSEKLASETTYYIKMRPGLKHFLEEVSKIYEMHIYTMGTRAYAKAVARIVDSDKKYFGERILSRDENGSMIAKNLQRLFPVDQKMVAIIDDRSDVWNWSKNLIRVSQFDFFTGSGDINASFLPSKPKIPGTPASETQPSTNTRSNGVTNGATNGTANGDSSALARLMEMSGGDDEKELKDKTDKAAHLIEAQVKERPLAQKQLALDQKEGPEPQSDADSDSSDKQNRQSLLSTHDQELTYIEAALRQVHKEFYEQYAQNMANVSGGRLGALRPGADNTEAFESLDLDILPDVKEIMSAMKERVLGGSKAVFSGVVPLDTEIRDTDLCVWAMSFGLRVRDRLQRSTTHLIAVRTGTAKVKLALRQGKGKIKVVNTQWLMDSILRWKRQDETPYMLHSEDDYISPLDARAGVEGDEADKLSDSEAPTDGTITDGDTTDGERARPKHLTIKTAKETLESRKKRVHADIELEAESDEEGNGVEVPEGHFDDNSPIGGDATTWEGVDDELELFMDGESDADESGDDDDDDDSVASDASNQKTERSRTPRVESKPSSKRRLEEVGSDAEEDDGPRKKSRDGDSVGDNADEVEEDDWDAIWEQEEERKSAENSPEEKEEPAFPITKGEAEP